MKTADLPLIEQVNSSSPMETLPMVQMGTAVTPMDMIDRAIQNGSSVEILERLFSLQERYEKNQARKAFDNAMAAAKAEIPVILKNKQVGFDSKKAGASRTDYMHEDLAQIARQINPILSKHGLSYRFRTSSNVNEPVFVTCIVSHEAGHSEENTLSAGRDESGNKSPIQGVGSTVSFLQRYTLKASLGLAAAADDDGKAAGAPGVITDDQADQIRTLITEVKADLTKFLEYIKAESISDIPASKFKNAVAALEAKRAKA